MKKILYIDMDGVIANFDKAINKIVPDLPLGDGHDYEIRSKMVDKIVTPLNQFFQELEPIEGAIEAVEILKDKYDVYFLSTPMSAVSHSYTGKKEWIEKHFGEWANKKLILTHRKDLCIGDILIDDRHRNGAIDFKGEFIWFGYPTFPNWESVLKYLT